MAKIRQIKVAGVQYDIEPTNIETFGSTHVTAALGYIPLGPDDVANNVTTASAGSKVLDAYQGKVLNDKITAIEGRGRYLTTWDASTGKPSDLPGGGASVTEEYTYRTGDYFIVKNGGSKVPTGTSIAVGTTIATFPSADGATSKVNDTIYFNGTTWTVLVTPVTQTVWGGIGGTLSNQTDLQTALNGKLSLSGGTMTGNITMGSSNVILTNSIKETDGNITILSFGGSGTSVGDPLQTVPTVINGISVTIKGISVPTGASGETFATREWIGTAASDRSAFIMGL